MERDILFDHEHPGTVHDYLWSWSRGYLTSALVIAKLHLDDEAELLEVAAENDVPAPVQDQE